jgi:hypothetical protein
MTFRRASGLIGGLSALALGLAFASSPAVAQSVAPAYVLGNTLWEACSSRNDLCLAYIVGTADAIQAARGSLLGWRVCLPNGVTEGQAMDVVVQFLSQHPEMRQYAATGLVANALANAFPCS